MVVFGVVFRQLLLSLISRHKNGSMGVFLGKPVMIETPLVTATKVCKDYEMRTYAPALAATTVCSGDMMQGSEGFRQLARYIGAFGTPANRKEAAAQTTEGEKIAMTAPVVTAQQGGGGLHLGALGPAGHHRALGPGAPPFW